MSKTAKWQEFSTASVPSSQRIRRWVELGSETLSDMIVSPTDRGAFSARLQRVEIGDMGLVFVRTTPASASGAASRTGPWATPDRDALVLTFVDRGRSRVSQDKWSVDLEPGDMVIRDLNRPWRSESDSDSDLILIKIPMIAVMRRIGDPARVIGRRLAGNLAPVAVAAATIRAIREALLNDPDGDWHALLSDVLIVIFRLACKGGTFPDASAASSAPAPIGRAAIAFILQNLHDPDLTVSRIADNAGIGVRQLQRIFLAHGKTPRQFILEQRLKVAADLIIDSSSARLTDIALSIGFNDMSHFSRAFARHFGCPPSVYRKLH